MKTKITENKLEYTAMYKIILKLLENKTSDNLISYFENKDKTFIEAIKYNDLIDYGMNQYLFLNNMELFKKHNLYGEFYLNYFSDSDDYLHTIHFGIYSIYQEVKNKEMKIDIKYKNKTLNKIVNMADNYIKEILK